MEQELLRLSAPLRLDLKPFRTDITQAKKIARQKLPSIDIRVNFKKFDKDVARVSKSLSKGLVISPKVDSAALKKQIKEIFGEFNVKAPTPSKSGSSGIGGGKRSPIKLIDQEAFDRKVKAINRSLDLLYSRRQRGILNAQEVERERRIIQAGIEKLKKKAAISVDLDTSVAKLELDSLNDKFADSAKKVRKDFLKMLPGNFMGNLLANLTSGAIKGAISALGNSLRSMFAGAVNMFGGLLSTTLRKGAEFSSGFRSTRALQVSAGSSVEEIQALNKAALDVAKTLPLTSSEIAGLTETLSRAGKTASEQVSKDILQTSAQLAIATDTLPATAAGVVLASEKILTGFDNFTAAADVLAFTANSADQDIEALGETLSSMKGVKMDLELFSLISKTLADIKITGSDQGTALRNTVTFMKKNAAFFEQQKIDIFDENNMLRDQGEILLEIARKYRTLNDAARAQFDKKLGERGAPLIRALSSLSDEEINTQLAKAEAAGGAVAKQVDIMTQGVEAQAKALDSQIDVLLTRMGENAQRLTGGLAGLANAALANINTDGLADIVGQSSEALLSPLGSFDTNEGGSRVFTPTEEVQQFLQGVGAQFSAWLETLPQKVEALALNAQQWAQSLKVLIPNPAEIGASFQAIGANINAFITPIATGFRGLLGDMEQGSGTATTLSEKIAQWEPTLQRIGQVTAALLVNGAKLTGILAEHGPLIAKAAVAMGVLSLAAQGVQASIGLKALATGLTGLVTKTGILTAAVSGAKVAFGAVAAAAAGVTLPVVATVAAVAGVVAGLIAVIKHWKTIRGWVGNVGKAIANNTIRTKAWGNAIEGGRKTLAKLREGLSGAFNQLKAIFLKQNDWWLKSKATQKVTTAIKNRASETKQEISESLSLTGQWLTESLNLQGVFEGIKERAKSVMASIGGWVTKFKEFMGLQNRGQQQGGGGFASPIAGQELQDVIDYQETAGQSFTAQRSGRLHGGIDFDARIGAGAGAVVQSVTDGVVKEINTIASNREGPAGSVQVVIETTDAFGQTVEQRYNHLSRRGVARAGITEGMQVSSGQRIGIVGSTDSLSTGAHLDYKVLVNGEFVNPDEFLQLAGAAGQLSKLDGSNANIGSLGVGPSMLLSAFSSTYDGPDNYRPRGGTVHNAERVMSDPAGAAAIVETARRLNLDPYEFAALMSWESAGSFNPNIMGGDGNQYQGLIQFSPENQQRYGITENMTIAEFMPAVEQYLKDRGFDPQSPDIRAAYSAVLAGNASEGYWDLSDSNGTTVRNASGKFKSGDHYERARQFLDDSLESGAGVTAQLQDVQYDGPPVDVTANVTADTSDIEKEIEELEGTEGLVEISTGSLSEEDQKKFDEWKRERDAAQEADAASLGLTRESTAAQLQSDIEEARDSGNEVQTALLERQQALNTLEDGFSDRILAAKTRLEEFQKQEELGSTDPLLEANIQRSKDYLAQLQTFYAESQTRFADSRRAVFEKLSEDVEKETQSVYDSLDQLNRSNNLYPNTEHLNKLEQQSKQYNQIIEDLDELIEQQERLTTPGVLSGDDLEEAQAKLAEMQERRAQAESDRYTALAEGLGDVNAAANTLASDVSKLGASFGLAADKESELRRKTDEINEAFDAQGVKVAKLRAELENLLGSELVNSLSPEIVDSLNASLERTTELQGRINDQKEQAIALTERQYELQRQLENLALQTEASDAQQRILEVRAYEVEQSGDSNAAALIRLEAQELKIRNQYARERNELEREFEERVRLAGGIADAEERESAIADAEELRRLGLEASAAMEGMDLSKVNAQADTLQNKLKNEVRQGLENVLGALADGTKSIGDALKNMVLSIGKMFVNEGIKKLVGGIMNGLGSGGGEGGGGFLGSIGKLLGFMDGGEIPRMPFAHSSLRFASGGEIPYVGGDPNGDSTPIWAQPGEYMLNRKSVAGMGGISRVQLLAQAAERGSIPQFMSGGAIAAQSTTQSIIPDAQPRSIDYTVGFQNLGGEDFIRRGDVENMMQSMDVRMRQDTERRIERNQRASDRRLVGSRAFRDSAGI